MRNESDIDDAIDRAVRDIMHAEPRAGFRGRVLARLRPASSGQRSWFTLPRFAAAMVVLAMAIAIAALLRPNAVVAPADTPVVAQKETPAPPEVRPSAAPQAPTGVDPGPKTGAMRPQREPAVAFPPPGMVTAASVPEAGAAALTARPAPGARSELIVITPAPLVIAPLIVPPIVIPPIIIQPIRQPR
jgi:hypothetical protein